MSSEYAEKNHSASEDHTLPSARANGTNIEGTGKDDVADVSNTQEEHVEHDNTQGRLSRIVSKVSTVSSKDPGPPPDGGLKAWLQVVAAHFIILNTWGFIASFGVFQTYYTTSLHRNQSDISWIGAVQIFLLFFIGTFSGRALDAGLFRLVLIIGIILQLLGVFMTSISTEYWQVFLAQGVCTGLGNGILFAPTMGLVATYFTSHRNLAMSIVASGGGTGGMIFPAMVSRLLPSIGFGWTVRTLGFFQLALDAIAFIILRTRIPPRKSGPLLDLKAFKEKTYTLFILGMFFNFWALYFAFYYIGSYARDRVGLSYPSAINLLITLNALGIIGRLVAAYLSDRYFGPLNVMMPLGLISGILIYSWYGVKSFGTLYVFAVLYGLFSNGIQGLFPATLSSLTTDLKKTGIRMGMAFTIVSFACLTGEPLGGALIQNDSGGYLYALMWAGSSMVVASCFHVAARYYSVGWTWGRV